jgi:hypothetical protein
MHARLESACMGSDGTQKTIFRNQGVRNLVNPSESQERLFRITLLCYIYIHEKEDGKTGFVRPTVKPFRFASANYANVSSDPVTEF